MEQLETFRLDSEPYPMEYRPTFSSHVIIIGVGLYILFIMCMMKSAETSFRAAIRH